MSVTRGGAFTQQLFILGTTIIAKGASRLITNFLNYTGYLRAQIHNIGAILHGSERGEVYLKSKAMQVATVANSSRSLPGSTVGGGVGLFLLVEVL
jgi:hypothetical protein